MTHPLQPFSPRYFDGDDARLFSYVDRYRAGAATLLGARCSPRPFLRQALPPVEGPPTVGLDDLIRFFANPARAFLQRRLDLSLDEQVDLPAEREPLQVDDLERWRIGQALIECAVRGEDLEAAFESFRARGVLPLGTPGTCLYRDLLPDVRRIADAARSVMGGDRLPPLELDAEIDGVRITGVLRDLWPCGQVGCGYSRLGRKGELDLWIRHLLLSWASPGGAAPPSLLCGRPAKPAGGFRVRFWPVPEARSLLRDLLRLYAIGLQVPLPFFPVASRAYAERSARDEQAALTVAEQVFVGTEDRPGEAADPHVRQVFGESSLADLTNVPSTAAGGDATSFAAAARRVFDPLLAHREEA